MTHIHKSHLINKDNFFEKAKFFFQNLFPHKYKLCTV